MVRNPHFSREKEKKACTFRSMRILVSFTSTLSSGLTPESPTLDAPMRSEDLFGWQLNKYSRIVYALLFVFQSVDIFGGRTR